MGKVVLHIALISILAHTAFGCLATLYRYDPLFRGIGLQNGTAAITYVDYHTYNNGDDLDFGLYTASNLTIAPEGRKLGAFVDLGTQQDVVQFYNLDGVASGDVYISIHYDTNFQLVRKLRSSNLYL
jgi:hypothetical protein